MGLLQNRALNSLSPRDQREEVNGGEDGIFELEDGLAAPDREGTSRAFRRRARAGPAS